MKKPYQIEGQRAVKRLEEMSADGSSAVQMVLPMAEMLGWLRKGVGELIRQAGLQVIELLMEEEVRELVGERSQRVAERQANRWGKERGFCVVMGQKVPIERPRVRTTGDREVRLTVVPIVFPLEVDLTVFDVDEAVVGDGHAMSVTAHVVEYLLGSGERTLGIDHPFGTLGSGDLPGESAGLAKWLQGAEELQFAGIERLLQGFQK